ncbi:hypothetical protein ACFW7J_26400 [Streptomyces sp. NPDC059525]|uniref:hypothetical protein n=1 Tax=Streptomyces sp. NPDC059525 TaxID=3346857 RepID=UPI0036A0E64A
MAIDPVRLTVLPRQYPGPAEAPPATSARPEGPVERLKEDCAALGIAPVPLRVRVALRRRLLLRRWKLGVLGAALLGCSAFGGLFVQRLIRKWVRGCFSDAAITEMHNSANPLLKSLIILQYVAVGLALAYGLLDLYVRTRADSVANAAPAGRPAKVLLARRYALVTQCSQGIHACAQSIRGGEQQAASLRLVSKRLNAIRRGILDAHDSRGTVPRFSHRRKELKQHERQVSAYLKKIESQLDRDPNGAPREIATALLQIADRYCHARVGQLLDEEQLQDLPPQRNWEVLRCTSALLLGAGLIAGLALTGAVPESAEPFVYPMLVAATLLIGFGPRFRRAVELLNAILGAV